MNHSAFLFWKAVKGRRRGAGGGHGGGGGGGVNGGFDCGARASKLGLWAALVLMQPQSAPPQQNEPHLSAPPPKHKRGLHVTRRQLMHAVSLLLRRCASSIPPNRTLYPAHYPNPLIEPPYSALYPTPYPTPLTHPPNPPP